MPKTPSNDNSGCLIPFGSLFALCGFAALVHALVSTRPDVSQTWPQLYVSLTFLIVGLGIFAFGRSTRKSAAEAKALTAQNPGKPWLWRDDWAQGYARPEWRSTAVTWGAAGVVCLLVSVPGVSAIPKIWNTSHRWETPVALVFPLAGLYLLSQSALAALREAKFRRMRLILSTLPGVIGGRVEASLETAYVFPPGTEMKLTLSCVRSYVSGSGDSRSHWETALWQDTQLATAYVGGPGSSISVAFITPYDSRETDARNPSDEIFWKLTAAVALAGLDFRAVFRVPVFKTEASDASLTTEKLNEKSESQLAGKRPRDAKITEEPSAEGGVQFHLGSGRNKGTAAGFALFGLFFLAGGAFFGVLVGKGFTWFLGVIPLLVGGLIGLFLLAFGIWMWFGQTTVGVLNRSLHIHSRCLGFSRSQIVDAGAIRRFELFPGMKSADKIWYDLKIHLDTGRTVTAGSAMEKSEAEWFLAELKKDLGVQTRDETT
ncbi:MAG TPA: hypothetical protein VK335_07125 [Bryobacteraceae bacterium]|nr:hypothetical protein [Bryobacteraceae bacterium]